MSQYNVIREIGRGGFGVVEEVEDARGNRFARKRFSPSAIIPTDSHDQLRERFKREVKVQLALSGGELMPILEQNLVAAMPWFVMPLATKTYEDQIEEDIATGRVNVDAVADILNGLQYLHDLDYVHRDLNPKNILFHEGVWKLSDFGAVLPPNGGSIILTNGTVIYTEQYCSPEQKKDFHAVKTSSDIYSFGCILHDIFGASGRIPYAKQTAPGDIGLIIEKCTEETPRKRPDVKLLRSLLLENLQEPVIKNQPTDAKTEEWLKKMQKIDEWTDRDYDKFARFFNSINIAEKSPEHSGLWVSDSSTPFLTRLPAVALSKIAAREDHISGAIIEKYCEWVVSTDFSFHFSDTICGRLTAIFDSGTPTDKARAFSALVHLADTHNRWYVMRCLTNRCRVLKIESKVAKRIAIELKTDGLEHRFARCVKAIAVEKTDLASDLAALCWN